MPRYRFCIVIDSARNSPAKPYGKAIGDIDGDMDLALGNIWLENTGDGESGKNI